MKFGKTILNSQIPEWSKNYMSYKALKKAINQAASSVPPPEKATTAIVFQLDRELEKVNTFYCYKQGQIDRRLWILSERYLQVSNPTIPAESANDSKDELASALQETRVQMHRLMWFGELNSKGFKKILKKLDKRLGLETQTIYWQTKVAALPFADPTPLRTEIAKVTSWIATLSPPSALKRRLSLPSQIKCHSPLTDQENERLTEAIENDNQTELAILLQSDVLKKERARDADQTLYGLLEIAVQHGSLACAGYLIEAGANPLQHKDINERNILHKLAIRSSEPDIKPQMLVVVCKLLDWFPHLASQTDFAGRRPLHYAAEAGHPEMTRVLMEHAIADNQYTKAGFKSSAWQDRDGHTPLFLAILHGNPDTLKVLIDVGHINDIDATISDSSLARRESISVSDREIIPDFVRSSHHPSSVATACKLSNLKLLELLIERGASVDMADEDGETALLIAIRNQFIEGVKALIEQGHASVNHADKINGWTPLIVAAIEGQDDITEMLLDAGADKSASDLNGWRAYEHAMFRGHMSIGKRTKPDCLPTISPFVRETEGNGTNQGTKPRTNALGSKAFARAGRMYGHKYLTDQSMVIITLGSNDSRNPLSRCFLNPDGSLWQDKRLSIAVSATNATGEFPILDLPTSNQHHLLHPDPIVLFTSRPEDVVLRFDVIETFGSNPSNSILARGTSVLTGDSLYSKTKAFKGSAGGNTSLRGQQTVPLVHSQSLEYAGSLGFEYFVVTPFSHPKMTVGDRYTYYKSVDTKVIGHRGSGMNRKGSRLQVGENTVLSFVTAASLGAEYVEFDVQLTKDLVPVIYHDWTVTETGYDIPLNAITLEQFLNLKPSGQIKDYHTGVTEDIQGSDTPSTKSPDPSDASNVLDIMYSTESPNTTSAVSSPGKRVNRSHSLSSIGSSSSLLRRTDNTHKLQLTQTNKLGKVKGNGPDTIQAPFTTLAETLKKVPKSAGCNIEVKYPLVDEAEADELHQIQELNIYVDTILECVYGTAEKDRNIIFSSFHPEICLALNLKQPNYPVFFLTDAGTFPMADVRCQSLQGAVRFAKQGDLLGIVAASEPILEAPLMVNVVKETGLLLFTYGILNNEVQNAVAQKYYGVDAVIVDSVLAVRKGLREGQPAGEGSP
ncbi:Glycerophosphoryl diester phosphodiesterase family-domain-containing protein [Phycomyces nitens]|nr:Glycerophosphoryl diester phosphodiesterase family-domain-containing protein [Phycomyces nitens]